MIGKSQWDAAKLDDLSLNLRTHTVGWKERANPHELSSDFHVYMHHATMYICGTYIHTMKK